MRERDAGVSRDDAVASATEAGPLSTGRNAAEIGRFSGKSRSLGTKSRSRGQVG